MDIRKIAQRKDCGNWRVLSRRTNLIDFASSDYLGLSRSQNLREKMLKECAFLPVGSTGSRLLTGNSLYAEELEEHIAHFHGFEAGLLFGCGYMANIGLLSAVADDEDTVYFDSDIHASTRDGIRLSKARSFPFRHNDLNHLEMRLKNFSGTGKKFVCIESIYSITGSIAPLEEMCLLCARYDAHLIVDEAHAVGLFGPEGRGLTAEKKVTQNLFAQVTTFGKAVGAYGAIVLGSASLKEYLINFSRSAIYSTSLPFHCLAAIKCAYDLFPKLEVERAHVFKLAALFEGTLIQCVKVRGNTEASNFSKFLAQKGFDLRPLFSPTVQRGHECLRICFHAFNTETEACALQNLIKEKNG